MLAVISASLPPVVWTLICGVLLTLGDIALRMWFASDFRNGFLIAFVLYMSGVFCMMMSFFEKNIAIATIAAVLVNTLIYLAVSHYLYGDTLSLWQMIGVGLGLVAIVILELH